MKSKNAKTSSFVFKLITKYTFYMLLILIAIIGCKQFFGISSSCKTKSGSLKTDVMNHKCWIKGEYDQFGRYMYNGRGWLVYREYDAFNPNYQGERYLEMDFYEWIVPLLLLHAFCFVVPRVHWHFKQEQTIPKCLQKLSTPEFTDEWITQRQKLISYFKLTHKSYHQSFAIKYLFCELFTIILNGLVMLLMNLVIYDFWNEYKKAAFSFFWLDFPQFYKESSRLFPKEANCDFYSFEVSKLVEHKNSVCTFHQNGFYAKVFAFLYIWYIFILTWAVLNFIILAAMYIFKCLRISHIRRMLERPSTNCECEHLTQNGDFGLWFTLRIFRRNMHLAHFQDFCTALLADSSCPSNA